MSHTNPINLNEDRFIRTIIHRKVARTIETAGLDANEHDDLVQEVFARATKSLSLYDPEVGHLYPYVCTVVQRHLANVVRDRSVRKRRPRRLQSLSKVIHHKDGQSTELNQLIGTSDSDRRLDGNRARTHLTSNLGMNLMPAEQATGINTAFSTWLSQRASAITVHPSGAKFLVPPVWYR